MRCAGESFDYSAVTGDCYLRDSVRGSVALDGASGADAVFEWCHYDKTGGSLAGGGAAAAVNCVGQWGEWGGCACPESSPCVVTARLTLRQTNSSCSGQGNLLRLP